MSPSPSRVAVWLVWAAAVAIGCGPWGLRRDDSAGEDSCLAGADADGDGLILAGYGPGAAESPWMDLPGFLDGAHGLDESCIVVTARQALSSGCREQPVLVYCPSAGVGRNIGNAVVYLATITRPVSVHRPDSPYAPAQLNVDLCSYQTACMGREAPQSVASGQQQLGSCSTGPVFADLFCHHGVEAALLGSDGAPTATSVGDALDLQTSCAAATWHGDDALDLTPLPLQEQRTLHVTATEVTTTVDIATSVALDAGCELWLGNSRRPFGALELTGPSYAQACFADGRGAAVATVPTSGADGLFWLGEGTLDLVPPLAARLHGGSEAVADVALCLGSVTHEVEGADAPAAFTSYGYIEPEAHPGCPGICHTLIPWDAWPTWPAARYAWSLEGRLAAGEPGAAWEGLCGEALAACDW